MTNESPIWYLSIKGVLTYAERPIESKVLTSQETSPTRLALHLAIYFAVILGLFISILQIQPDVIEYLPLGGNDALDSAGSSDIQGMISSDSMEPELAGGISTSDDDTAQRLTDVSLFMIGHLSGTILLMVPITWTYKAIKYRGGFNKNFVRSLIILPICATTTVLLIQDSLSLAFGLAALVAAVRFRVVLEEAIDGIFIFAAICVGLAAGIGYLGIALIMCIFFCFGNQVLWHMDYGRNPMEEAKLQKKRAKANPSQGES